MEKFIDEDELNPVFKDFDKEIQKGKCVLKVLKIAK